MKIMILANPEDPHTIKWVTQLAKQNIHIYLFGLNKFDRSLYNGYPNVQLESGGFGNKYINSRLGNFSKIIYLKSLPTIKRIIRDFKPDIIHAHYASSYGILISFVDYSPIVLSFWGSDIYRFPKQSFIHQFLIRKALAKSSVVLSTCENMALEIKKYINKDVVVIPFGIDTQMFKPNHQKENDTLIIGTVRKLEKLYGVDVLIQAFKMLIEKKLEIDLNLLIVGDGPERRRLEMLTRKLNISKYVHFEGKVQTNKVPQLINKMDIFSALSIYDESFGVAVLEACSCEKPVVVSDVVGFKEIVKDGKTGLIVERNNSEQAASALEALIKNEELRLSIGKNARQHVIQNYSLNHNVEQMLEVYHSALGNSLG
ncbi:MAG: glycosyltransferase family 4 protein [Bacteroidales bacterium]|nr:glycosyltransferase family 4 protein [Bacteroidales bacterium]